MGLQLQLMATLWPSMPHFPQFAVDSRLSGIRLNGAAVATTEIKNELEILEHIPRTVPMWFDVKGRQLRIDTVHRRPDYLDITLNHPISLFQATDQVVLFKAGADAAVLGEIRENGQRLVFKINPHFEVREDDSLHIRHPSMRVLGPIFTEKEKAKIAAVRAAGFTRYFISYVEEERDLDELRELVGHDVELMLKIENIRGLKFVAQHFRKHDGITLVAARGDMYVEVDQPHDILRALRLIIEKDPEACVGSRMLLSIIKEPVPSCADLCEMAWLYDLGYRNMLLCDELCLKGDLLDTAVNVFQAFREDYARP